MTNSVQGKKLFLAFCRVLSEECYFLTLTRAIYSYLLMTLILQIMQMTVHPMPQKTQRVKLFSDWKIVLVICFNDQKIRNES